MKTSIVWSERARSDLIGILDYIAMDSSDAARIFIASLMQKVEALADLPRLGRVVPEYSNVDLRKIIFGNYRIVYTVSDTVICIVTVFEGHKLVEL